VNDILAQVLEEATPEEQQEILSALLRTHNVQNQNELLEGELKKSLGLQEPSGHQYSTGGGAALGAAGDILRAWKGAQDESQIREQMRKNTSSLEDPEFLSNLLRARNAYKGISEKWEQASPAPLLDY
jgi:hypothetical protein